MPCEYDRTVAEHPNILVVREFYKAFESDDAETAVRGFLGPGITWHVAGDNTLAGTFHGPDQVWNAMTRYGEHSHGTLRLDTRSVFADDEHAVAIHRATAKVPGFDYHAHEVDVFHISGKRITEMWSFSEDQAATDRVWS
jgi:ketosteroid isomerase-like protein